MEDYALPCHRFSARGGLITSRLEEAPQNRDPFGNHTMRGYWASLRLVGGSCPGLYKLHHEEAEINL